MKNFIFSLLLLITYSTFCSAKTIKTERSKTTDVEQIFSKQLKGYEADYLTKKEFRLQVKQKKIWGIIEIIVNWVASWFSDSYGKYDEDTYTSEGHIAYSI